MSHQHAAPPDPKMGVKGPPVWSWGMIVALFLIAGIVLLARGCSSDENNTAAARPVYPADRPDARTLIPSMTPGWHMIDYAYAVEVDDTVSMRQPGVDTTIMLYPPEPGKPRKCVQLPEPRLGKTWFWSPRNAGRDSATHMVSYRIYRVDNGTTC